MYRKLFAASFVAAALTACGDKPEQETPELVCDSPAVLQSVRANIQEIVKQEAQVFARNDSRQFVDADKIIAAATQLDMSLDNPAQEDNNGAPVCSANLNIQIPTDIFNTAQTNAPLIYGSQSSITQQVQQRISGSLLSYEQGRFTRPLRYTTAVSDGQTTVNYEDNAITATAQALSTALMPYGVKSILVINGQHVRREEALNMGSQPFPEPPQADPLDILENNSASAAAGQPASEPESPEMLSPETQRNTDFPANELEQAKRSNQAANNEINRVWNSIDRTIQKELLGEQRTWIQTKNNNCRRVASHAESPAQASYLQLQCDTRMTRERSQYLRGYSID